MGCAAAHHGAHHPAHVDGAAAAGAVAASVLQELGVHVQDLQAGVQDLGFKLCQRKPEEGGGDEGSPPPGSLP